MIVVPLCPAHGVTLLFIKLPFKYFPLYAHCELFVFVVIVTFATYVILLNASPRKPNVEMDSKSINSRNFEVVKRVHNIDKSSLNIPQPLSFICNKPNPPSFKVTLMEVEPASKLFSSNSFNALNGF